MAQLLSGDGRNDLNQTSLPGQGAFLGNVGIDIHHLSSAQMDNGHNRPDSVTGNAMPYICKEKLSPAFRSVKMSLAKPRRDVGNIEEAVLGTPLISSWEPLAKAVVMLMA